ncbi:unnamed protein product [Cyprideis torosa]|uniref:Uncharacterized protein n=1 Tax=Cyprideis torosa TaxID=163714 RepID=A0A7R8W590_9CRUS|nr:unnamed protein product [Cyprideis torosa]CAG0884994.1 unnamed protein product [Cyprideis torosa]
MRLSVCVFITFFLATAYSSAITTDKGAPRLPVYPDQCTHPFRAVSGGRCYFLSYGSLQGSWEAAQQVCSWLHPTGRLAEFESGGELIDATSFLNEDVTSCSVWPSPGPWIGGVEVGSSGEFVWSSTNASILSTNWADNEPDSTTSGDAIALDCENEFKWRDLETTTSLPFMCESDANPPPVIWGCPGGFQMVGEGCYHFGAEQLNFDDSLTYCRGLGGKLLEFETVDEMYEFNDYFTENPPTPCGDIDDYNGRAQTIAHVTSAEVTDVEKPYFQSAIMWKQTQKEPSERRACCDQKG